MKQAGESPEIVDPSFQQSCEELRQDLHMGSTGEDLERAAKPLVCPVKVRYIKRPRKPCPSPFWSLSYITLIPDAIGPLAALLGTIRLDRAEPSAKLTATSSAMPGHSRLLRRSA